MIDKLAAFASQPTMSPAYVANGNTPWASRYAQDVTDVVLRYAARLPRNVQRHLGPSELGSHCLTGDTEVVTRQGHRLIRELAGVDDAEILVPMRYKDSDVRKRWGRFVKAPVAYFGEQETFEITLRQRNAVKVVRATGEHRWFRTYYSGKQKKQECLTTQQLRPGHRLSQLRRAMPRSATLMDVAVAQGFVFGDGSRESNRKGNNRVQASRLHIWDNGKDAAMLKFFSASSVKDQKHRAPDPDRGCQLSHVIGPLPKFWKDLPPLGESSAFLVSWLAGYFAADGSVGKDDGHCVIDSAERKNLEFVRDLAAVCGIGYGQISKTMRVGISGKGKAAKATPIYRLSLRRRDLPEWFFLIDEHKRRVVVANLRGEHDADYWAVESVKRTGRVEPVYCATVEGVGAFGLADGLLTGNCNRKIVGKMAGVKFGSSAGAIASTYTWASIMGTAMHAFLEQAFIWDSSPEGGNPGRWHAERRVTPDPQAERPHPGTADLFDTLYFSVDDHKGNSEAVRTRLRRDGPPYHYFVQLLLYAVGYMHEGFDVQRVVLISWPRTKSTLDDLYVWAHVITNDDLLLVERVLKETAVREEAAKLVVQGRLNFFEIPPAPSSGDCEFCPFNNPAALEDGTSAGCPGMSLLQIQRKAYA